MRRTAALVLAVGGIALGHTVTYSLLPDQGQAHAVAHAYPQQFAAAALVSLVVLLLWWSVQEARGRSHTLCGFRLVAAQLAGFAALEIGERALVADVAAVLEQPALWFGLVVQAAVAVILRQGFQSLPRLVAGALARPRDVPPIERPGNVFAFTPFRRPTCDYSGSAAGPRAPPPVICG